MKWNQESRWCEEEMCDTCMYLLFIFLSQSHSIFRCLRVQCYTSGSNWQGKVIGYEPFKRLTWSCSEFPNVTTKNATSCSLQSYIREWPKNTKIGYCTEVWDPFTFKISKDVNGATLLCTSCSEALLTRSMFPQKVQKCRIFCTRLNMECFHRRALIW